jgi:hypothetical protein
MFRINFKFRPVLKPTGERLLYSGGISGYSVKGETPLKTELTPLLFQPWQ